MADDSSTDSTASTARSAVSLLVASKGGSKPKSSSSPRRRFSPSRRLAQEKKKIEATRAGQLRALERL